MNRPALLLVALALILGGYLRFANLGVRQMSADEGASWAAGAAASLGEVVAIQQTHNPGKLPMHEIVLHQWISVFGDGLVSMRALSAVFGLLAVLLMMPLARELLHTPGGAALEASEVSAIAALSALICAVSLVTIKYSREARMYSMMLAIVMAQVWFVLRALRRGGAANYVGVALFTAAAIAANLATAPMLAAEGLWLVYLIASANANNQRPQEFAWATGFSIVAGLAILAPAFYVPLRYGKEAISAGKFDWLQRPPLWAPASLFSKASGTFAFPVMAALSAWGIWRGWSRSRNAIALALLWMWAPPVLMVIGSYLWHPMFLERYALYCFPPFFILTALGIAELGPPPPRILAAAAVVSLALGHVHTWSLKLHDSDWHEAAHVAAASLRPDGTVAVAPPYAVEVVRYYMIPAARPYAVPYGGTANSSVVILRDHGVNRATAAQVHREYPHLLAHPRGVVVLAR